MKRTMTIGLLVAMLMTMIAGSVSADPTSGETFYVSCTNEIPDGWITSPPNEAPWTPGLQIDGTGVYVPYAFEFNATFHPAGGGDPVDLSDAYAKNAPKNTKSHRHGVCTFEGEESLVDDPYLGTGDLVFSATAWVFWTGK